MYWFLNSLKYIHPSSSFTHHSSSSLCFHSDCASFNPDSAQTLAWLPTRPYLTSRLWIAWYIIQILSFSPSFLFIRFSTYRYMVRSDLDSYICMYIVVIPHSKFKSIGHLPCPSLLSSHCPSSIIPLVPISLPHPTQPTLPLITSLQLDPNVVRDSDSHSPKLSFGRRCIPTHDACAYSIHWFKFNPFNHHTMPTTRHYRSCFQLEQAFTTFFQATRTQPSRILPAHPLSSNQQPNVCIMFQAV